MVFETKNVVPAMMTAESKFAAMFTFFRNTTTRTGQTIRASSDEIGQVRLKPPTTGNSSHELLQPSLERR